MLGKQITEITYKDINELLYVKQEREGQRLDYKREFNTNSKEFAKDVTAFANAEGGFVIYGIDEKEQKIIGISDLIGNQKIEDWIANTLNSNIDITVHYEFQYIAITDEENPLYIFILEIKEGTKKPIYVTSDSKAMCYIRKGTSVFSAKPSDIEKMYAKQNPNQITNEITVSQQSKGNHNLQIGVNKGKVEIKTDKVVKRNEVKPNLEDHISETQAKEIKEKIDEIVEINSQAKKGEKKKFYPETWQSFYNRFHITSYKLLPKETFEEAFDWLQKQIAYKHRPKLRKANNEQWKKDIYGAIYAKSQNDLGMDKEDLYNFAFEKLQLKKPITSLKELSDTRLNKLYKLIFTQ